LAGEENNSAAPLPPPPSDDRRNRISDQDAERGVAYVDRGISQEKLDSLKLFLKTATADDIATIRKLYGDNLAVLRLIGFEIEDS
jgi:hypothetical protein